MTDAPVRRISPWWLSAPVIVFGLQFLAVASGEVAETENGVYDGGYLALAAVSAAIFGGYAVAAAALSRMPVRSTLAVVRPAGGAFPPIALAYLVILVLNLALDPLLGGEEAQGITPERMPAGGDEWVTLAAALLVLCMIVPFGEELMFRGLGFATLGRYAVPLTAALFAVAHSLPELLPVVFLAGLILGELRRRTGSLLPGVAVHGLLNATGILLALATA